MLSIAFAAPVHRRVDAAGTLSSQDARKLLRYNGIRLATASASLITVAALSWTYLAGTT